VGTESVYACDGPTHGIGLTTRNAAVRCAHNNRSVLPIDSYAQYDIGLHNPCRAFAESHRAYEGDTS